MCREVKTIYLATRAAGLAREDFPRRWRRHGELAMSLGFWRDSSGYYHCDARADPAREHDTETPEAWSGEYDGVGQVYFPSTQAYESLVTHRDFPRLLMDEWGAFREPVSNFSVLTSEEQLLEKPGTAVKAFWFLRPAVGVDAQAFRDRWTEHAGLVMRSDDLMALVRKYFHNHPVGVEDTADDDASIQERIRTGLPSVAGVAEMGFASRGDLVRYLGHPARRGLGEHLRSFAAVDQSVIVETNEVTMDARRAPAA
jgi:hypothetical protein